MGIEIVIIIIAAVFLGAYMVKSKTVGLASGSTPPAVAGTPTASTYGGPSGPIPPHLLVGANLLTDQEISQMEADIIGNHFTYASDKPRFIQQCLSILQSEQIRVSDLHCANGGVYQGPPMTLAVLKDGSLALGTTEGLATAGVLGGGGVGSLTGIGSSGFAAAGTTAATVIPIIGIGISAAISIFSIISSHHAAAVRNEQGLECSLIPPANKSLEIIEQAVVTGVITIQQGQQALDKLLSDFKNASLDGSAGQMEDRPGKLNAMGWYVHFLDAIILKKKNRYANLVS